MRQEIKHMSPKEKQFSDMLEDPELQPLLQKKLAQLLTTKNIDCLLEEIIFRKLSENGVLNSVEFLKQFVGVDPKTHCIGEDWDWDDMSPLERQMYPEKRKIIVQPLQAQLVQLQERIDNSSIPVLHETEKILISGNVTEIRARLLRDKLRDGKKITEKFMTSPQLADFLMNDVPEEFRAETKSAASKAAFDVMRKAWEMFPEELREAKAKRRGAKVIEYIEKMDF
jgi:hypothetical protein